MSIGYQKGIIVAIGGPSDDDDDDDDKNRIACDSEDLHYLTGEDFIKCQPISPISPINYFN